MTNQKAAIAAEQIEKLYRVMQIIRQTEEELARCHQRGLVHGACHTYVGEEAIATGVCAHLNERDVVFSTHRGHGHALAKGMPPKELMAELFGRATGCSRGRGGSMHLFSPEIGMMGTSGIVGPSILQACGGGYSSKILKNRTVAVAFFGDGAVNNGASHEGLNMASIWKLPVLFICENNQLRPKCPSPRQRQRPCRRRGECTASLATNSMATTCSTSTASPARPSSAPGAAAAQHSSSAKPTALEPMRKAWAISPTAPAKKSPPGKNAAPSAASAPSAQQCSPRNSTQ